MVFDINCDLGEGLLNDALLMPHLNSCNIACGAHAGDEGTIRECISLAKKWNVKVGAHPSYPDRLNFGRKAMLIDNKSLKSSLLSQLSLFNRICIEEGVLLHHIKLHGALYNLAAKDEHLASLIVGIMNENYPKVILYCPPDSLLANLAEKSGIPTMREVFADRSYRQDHSLVERDHPKALLIDPKEVLEHVKSMVEKGQIKTIEGNLNSVEAETLCIHGDNPAAVMILETIRKNFK